MNGKILDGWKEIAEYVGKSARTVQRWEKEEGFPVRRIKSKKSVFAYADEIDNWLENRKKNQTKEIDAQKNDNLEFDKDDFAEHKEDKERVLKDSVSKRHFLTILIVFAILIAGYSFTSYYKVRMLQKRRLFFEIEGGGSVINIKDQRGEILKTFCCNSTVYKNFLYPIGNYHHFQFVDINNDNILDLVFGEVCPDRKHEIKVFITNSDGELVERNTIDLDFNYEIKRDNYVYRNFIIQNLRVSDINNDGKPEIIVVQNNVPFYPSCVRIFDTFGNERFRFLNPGRLRSLEIRKNGDRSTIILSGTNNYLHRFSLPVLIFLTSDWNFEGKTLDFIQYGNTNFNFSNSIKTVYLTFFPTSIKINYYPLAQIAKLYKQGELLHFVAFTLPDMKELKQVVMGLDFKIKQKIVALMTTNDGHVVNSLFTTDFVVLKDIKDEEEYKRKYLKVLYYNGEEWSREYTPIVKPFTPFKKLSYFQ